MAMALHGGHWTSHATECWVRCEIWDRHQVWADVEGESALVPRGITSSHSILEVDHRCHVYGR